MKKAPNRNQSHFELASYFFSALRSLQVIITNPSITTKETIRISEYILS